MIVTVTPNPSVDRAFDVPELEVGEVNRASGTKVDAGGKGINVSRGLTRFGMRTVAVFPNGGPDAALMVSELQRLGVPVHPVPVAGAVRSNITVTDEAGVTTKVNAPGPELSEAEQTAIVDAVATHLGPGTRYLEVAGSLPEGVPASFVVRLGDLASANGIPFALDTSGAPLAAAVLAGGLAIVKPNDEELAELVGRELNTVGDVRDAARQVLSHGNKAVLVSLGAHGALHVTAEGCWWAGGDAVKVLSTVAAGDSTLAGYLSVEGPETERLRTAVAWGRAAVQLPGSEVPRPRDIDLRAVRIVADPDPNQLIKEL